VAAREGDEPPAVLGRSPSFDVPRVGVPAPWGRSRAVHDGLVGQLAEAGWRREGRHAAWYATTFVRERAPAPPPGEERGKVVLRRAGREARWKAVRLDRYGNAAPLSASPPFRVPRRGRAQLSDEARWLRTALVRHLERSGWTVVDLPAGPSHDVALRRRVRRAT
jgi:hypothetical protein